MRCWTAAIPKGSTSSVSPCAGCARPSRSSRRFCRRATPPGWNARRAASSACSARRATGTCSSPRRWRPCGAARPADDHLKRLAQAAEAERARAYEQAEALRAPAYTAFLLRFGRWIETAGWRDKADRALLDQPLARLAGRLLDKRHARVLKRGRGFERLSDDRLHRLRIALKKLRYAGEFLAAQFPDGRPRPYIKAARRLQDDLGRLNDAAVAERHLSALLRAQPEGAALAALGVGAGQVIGWHARAREEARARINGDWRAFAAAEPYWRAGSGRDDR